MRASLLNLPVNATHGVDPRGAFVEAKSLAARLHVNVVLSLGHVETTLHATSDIEALVAGYEKYKALEAART